MINKRGFIVIQHAILTEITDQECEKAIRKARSLGQEVVDFEYVQIRPVSDSISHNNMDAINFQEAAALQEDFVEEIVKPLFKKYPTYEVLYFGAAPIPLAIHLGYLLEGWKRIEIFLRHHKDAEEKQWYQTLDNYDGPDLELECNGIPNDHYDISDDLILKVGISYKLIDEEVDKSINSKVAKTTEIAAKDRILDLQTVQDCYIIADRFEDILKAIVDNLPKIDTVHLIAAVPVGLAFLLGRKIRNNISYPVQTYQYNRNTDFSYSPRLTINQSYEAFIPLTLEELGTTSMIGDAFKRESWENLQAFVTQQREQATKNPQDNWLDAIIGSTVDKGDMEISYWENLQHLHETAIANKEFVFRSDISGFDYNDSEETWVVGSRLIHNLGQRLTETKQIHKALRIILIHEGLHYYQHNLSRETVEGIGRFPKIVEDADYQADIYAILHEFAYSKLYERNEFNTEGVGRFFAKTLDVVLAALWAFNDPGVKLKEIQVRRLNRFLIWYWQSIAINDSRVKTIEQVISILAVKPVFEIKGLEIKAEGERVEYQLERYVESNLELGIFINNKIIRSGNTGYLRIPDLIRAFSNREHEKIKNLLEGFYRGVDNWR